MAGTFLLELVSPERLLLSRQVEMVTIPAAEGEMGVLPGHAPMIVALGGGVIRVRENGGAEGERLFVGGGIAEVSPDRCTVLADEATPLDKLSRTEAERRLAEAEAALNTVGAEDTEARRDAALGRVLAMRAMRDAAQAA